MRTKECQTLIITTYNHLGYFIAYIDFESKKIGLQLVVRLLGGGTITG